MIASLIASLPQEQGRIAQEIRALALAAHPSVTEGYRYRVPFFKAANWFCYLNPLKNGAMDLCFLQGQELADPDGLLEARDRKLVSSIVVTGGSPSREAMLSVPFDAIEVNIQSRKLYAGSKRIA
jgi:hypothetical protein